MNPDRSAHLDETTDQQLAIAAQAGSVVSFEHLVRRHQGRVVRFVSRHIANRTDAEDVAQDAFVRAYENLAKYDASRKFITWLLTIAYRLAISHYRSHRRDARPLEPDAELADGPSSPETRFDNEPTLWNLARDVLSDEQYSALWMFYAEEMSGSEIAAALGRSWVSVKVMLHRARSRLRLHLDKAMLTENTLR